MEYVSALVALQADGSLKDRVVTVMNTAVGCDTITFRWRFDAKATGNDRLSTNMEGDPFGVGGLDLLHVDLTTNKLDVVHTEFNVGAIL